MCGPEDPPFSCLSRSSQGYHFKQNSLKVSSHDPLLRKIWKFNLYDLNFNSQAPKFDKFQFTSPFFQRQNSLYKHHTLEIWAAHPYLKIVECPMGDPHSGNTPGWFWLLGMLFRSILYV